MGRVILCVGKTANIPFLLKKPGIHVYTAEEFCYCIREHTFLMDEEVVCKELADWLGEECGLRELAEEQQIILFTCQRREGDYLGWAYPQRFHYIKLQENAKN